MKKFLLTISLFLFVFIANMLTENNMGENFFISTTYGYTTKKVQTTPSARTTITTVTYTAPRYLAGPNTQKIITVSNTSSTKHTHKFTYRQLSSTSDYHIKACNCGLLIKEKHTYNKRICVCGRLQPDTPCEGIGRLPQNIPQQTAPNTGISESDFNLLCRLADAEAKGQSVEERMAVIEVVLNRVNSDQFPNTIREVIYEYNGGWQFTPVFNGTIDTAEPTEETINAVTRVLEGERIFNNEDVTYYCNVSTSDSTTFFYKNLTPVTEDGQFVHTFWKLKD
ncbi:MAG: cell wall hydrolase [Clostridia bacterium]|nr:cell wall hydrolase [Clostridia bacterium]